MQAGSTTVDRRPRRFRKSNAGLPDLGQRRPVAGLRPDGYALAGIGRDARRWRDDHGRRLRPAEVLSSMSTRVPVGDALDKRVAADLARAGWSCTPEYVSPDVVAELRHEALELWADGSFRHARVGEGAARVLRPEVRTDHVHWLDPSRLTPAQRALWERVERLRLAINETLLLGVFDFEAHLALYPPGAYYRKHLDQFKNAPDRLVTCIVYLNEAWTAEDGGCLRLYPAAEPGRGAVEVVPHGGTLVSFLAGELWHEVLPARRPRLSVTGWLRRRRSA